MKINQILAIMLGLTCAVSQPYFWENWGRPLTQEDVEKREIDLKHQKKVTDIEYKQRKGVIKDSDKARERQVELDRKKAQAELDRKKDRLKLDR